MGSIQSCPGFDARGCGTAIRVDQELCGFCRQEQRERGLGPAPAPPPAVVPPREESELTMAGPRTATFTCKTCKDDFDHTFPNGMGRAPSYCPPCKSGRTGKAVARSSARSKDARAVVPRSTAPPAARQRPRDGGGQRKAVAVAHVEPATTRPSVAQAVEVLVGELAHERNELDLLIGALRRRFSVVAGVVEERAS